MSYKIIKGLPDIGHGDYYREMKVCPMCKREYPSYWQRTRLANGWWDDCIYIDSPFYYNNYGDLHRKCECGCIFGSSCVKLERDP